MPHNCGLLVFDAASTQLYTLSLHDALPILAVFISMRCTLCGHFLQVVAVFISMRCTLCGHFLQVALTLILVVGYARSEERFSRNAETDLVCRLLLEKKNMDIRGWALVVLYV